VKIQRFGRMSAVALVGALALTACGSDNNTTSASGTAGGGGSTANIDCAAGEVQAEGSSAQKNAIELAIKNYQSACAEATLSYNPTGSGAGIKQFIAGQVDFAGSDSVLSDQPEEGVVETEDAAKTCGSPAWNLPMVTGPIAITYNVPGVDKLVLTPDVAAQIFQGRITTWDDPAIAKINQGVKLPGTRISVFFRADESGTTENFTKYLSATAKDLWTADPSKVWSGKGEGKNKSAGVASAVKSTEGGITYAEWSYAVDNKLDIAQIDNGAGPVELNSRTVGKAVDAAKNVGKGHDIRLELDYATKEKGAYPILLVTYEIVCSKGQDEAKTKLTKSFLSYFSSKDGQKSLEAAGYAPLPEEVRTKVSASVDALS
jgi:phosphate transport system substrate-binding protein